MRNLNLRNKVIELTNTKLLPVVDNLYRETLRSMINVMGSLYYLDGNSNRINAKCTHGNPERIVSRLRADNTLILPLVSVSESSTSNAEDRRRNSNIIISEKKWDPNTRRAIRVISVAPRPVTITYEVNLWAKYKSDLDTLRAGVYSLFSPDLDIKTKYSDYNKAFIVSERDGGSVIAGDAQDRVLKKSITISLETYIPSPKFQITNTGEILDMDFEVKIPGVTTKPDAKPPIIPPAPTNTNIDLGVVELLLSASGFEWSGTGDQSVDLGTANLLLSASGFEWSQTIGLDTALLALTSNDPVILNYGIRAGNEEITLEASEPLLVNYGVSLFNPNATNTPDPDPFPPLGGNRDQDLGNSLLNLSASSFGFTQDRVLDLGSANLSLSANLFVLQTADLGTWALETSTLPLLLNYGVSLSNPNVTNTPDPDPDPPTGGGGTNEDLALSSLILTLTANEFKVQAGMVLGSSNLSLSANEFVLDYTIFGPGPDNTPDPDPNPPT
jgi:hypothetical protein